MISARVSIEVPRDMFYKSPRSLNIVRLARKINHHTSFALVEDSARSFASGGLCFGPRVGPFSEEA